MDAWVPFFQTCLWVLLIGSALCWFRAEIAELLKALGDRVRGGSPIKVGPFELGESPPVQSVDFQKREMAEMVREVAAEQADVRSPSTAVRNRVFLSEELAIRELQSEFGVSINRQVAVGPDSGMDGMFVKDGRGFGIEVKFTREPLQETIASRAVSQLKEYAARLGWRRFTLVLAVVLDGDDVDREAEQRRVERAVQTMTPDVIVRVYSFGTLAKKYGLDGP